ncbi:MAG: DUF4340 domain-containing protein [Rhizobiales bacterium]|nr:DUF4340 domain-containing protein [Hyphomicrobiales bacterium]
MRFWVLLTGAVAALGLFVVILLVAQPTDRPVSGFTATDEGELFPGVGARLDQVRTMAIESSGPPLTLEKAGEEWRVPQHHGYPARSDKIDEVLQVFASLRADYVAAESSRNGISGVTDPGDASSLAIRVRLLGPGKEVVAAGVFGHTLTVPGDADPTKMLVRRDRDRRVWLATPVVRIETDPRTWLKRDIVDVPRDRVAELVTTSSDGGRIALRRSNAGGLRVAEGAAGRDLTGEPQLEAAAGALKGLQFNDVRRARTVEDRARDDGSTTVATADGLSYTIRWLSDKDQTWATFSARATGSQTTEPARQAERFNARHATWAYRLPAHVAQYLRVSAADVRNIQRSNTGVPPETGERPQR